MFGNIRRARKRYNILMTIDGMNPGRRRGLLLLWALYRAERVL